MDHQNVSMSRENIYCVLQECTKKKDLAGGRRLHSLIVSCGLDSTAFWVDHLIRLFASCWSLSDANGVFCKVSNPSVYTWSAMISAHTTLGDCEGALELYWKMQQTGSQPDKVTFLCTLKACSSFRALEQGRMIHVEIIRSGLESNVTIGNTLVDMYAKCGVLDEARRVFDEMPSRNVVSWGAMIAGYAQHSNATPALELFQTMQHDGIKPDRVIFICLLKACGIAGAVEQGRLIHGQIIINGFMADTTVGNTLVDMYVKCGRVEEGLRVFDELPFRDDVTWNVIIAGHAQHGNGLAALELFEIMQQDGIGPDKARFLCVLKVCAGLRALWQGKMIHEQLVMSRLESDVMIGSTLIDMYAQCGSLHEAHRVFDDLPSRDSVVWGAMIRGYAEQGLGLCALKLFMEMQEDDVKPSEVTFSMILKACTSIGAIWQGRLIHEQIIARGLESDIVVGNTLIDMFAKYGSLEDAHWVFCGLETRNEVSWGAMITGYVQFGHDDFALELFQKMQQDGIEPNVVMFLCILKVCSSTGAIEQGRLTHEHIKKCGYQSDIMIGNALVDMYAKCGKLKEAHAVFEDLPRRDLVSWAAMIAGYAQVGNHRMVEQSLEDMQLQGIEPHHVIFTSILGACGRAGLLEDGHRYFKSMIEIYKIVPTPEQYSCIVDLLGRAGFLDEAEDVLQTMPSTPDLIMWTSLLTSCKTYGNIGLGRRCFKHAVELDPEDASGYMLMVQMYSDAHMLQDGIDLQDFRKLTGVEKKPGKAWIEINNKMHEFIAGWESQSRNYNIVLKSKRVCDIMKHRGYLPQMDLAQLISSEDNEYALFGQLETMRASSLDSATIQSINCLHTCTDSHNARKDVANYENGTMMIPNVVCVKYRPSLGKEIARFR